MPEFSGVVLDARAFRDFTSTRRAASANQSSSAGYTGQSDECSRRSSGYVFPTKFNPTRSGTPGEIFSGRKLDKDVIRYVLPRDRTMGVIYTDGACSNNGYEGATAGWAFWHGCSRGSHPGSAETPLLCSGPLEAAPTIDLNSRNTNNRAELCAVIAALRFKYWPSVFRIVVIATDSYYVVAGATVWAKTWIENGWETASGEPVKNQDLWEELLREVKRYKNANAQVQFWRIPREWNEVADAAAKRACR